MMNISEMIGFAFEWLLLGLGIACYLIAIGRIQVTEKFRRDNQIWLRYGGLFLAAMMVVNLFLHFTQTAK